MAQALTSQEIQTRLEELNAGADTVWEVLGGKLHCEFRFASFVQAFAFMTECALTAERLDHHPEWFNVYNRVRVDLTTHDAGGITPLDFELARAMNAAAS